MKIGLIVADIDEYKPLEDIIAEFDAKPFALANRTAHSFVIDGKEVISVNCGLGKVNAAVATAALAEKGINIILNFGLSGGISGISRGEITIPDRFLEHDFDLTCLGYKPCEKPQQASYIYNADKNLTEILLKYFAGAKQGTAVTGDCFVQNDALRSKLKTEFSAMSCDMETAAIAYVCDAYGIPFASVRKVSDDAGNDAKNSYRELNEQHEAILSCGILNAIREI